LQVKLCDPCPSALEVVTTMRNRAYESTYTLVYFTVLCCRRWQPGVPSSRTSACRVRSTCVQALDRSVRRGRLLRRAVTTSAPDWSANGRAIASRRRDVATGNWSESSSFSDRRTNCGPTTPDLPTMYDICATSSDNFAEMFYYTPPANRISPPCRPRLTARN